MSEQVPAHGASAQMRVWDLPVRLCHWGFVILLPILWWTAENGEMRWHMRAGSLMLALVLFRIAWGLVGSSTARFAGFVRGPVAVISYLHALRQRADKGAGKVLGHNPAGGWSVLILLTLLAAQAVSGLFAGDPYDGATGPLNDAVGVMRSGQLTDWHKDLGFNLILGFVALHLLAIAIYRFGLGDRLIGPMISGKKAREPGMADMAPVPAWRAAMCAIVSAGIALWVYNGAPGL